MLMKTKTCMLNSNFKSVLSYGCETWEVATHITNKLQKFVNQSLRGIMSIRWSEIIINTGLWEAAREEPIILQIRMRKWQGSVILWGRGMNLLKNMHWIRIYREPGEASLEKDRSGGSKKMLQNMERVKMLAGNWVRWRFFTNALFFLMERKKLWLLLRSNAVDHKEMDGECRPGLADGFGFMSKVPSFRRNWYLHTSGWRWRRVLIPQRVL